MRLPAFLACLAMASLALAANAEPARTVNDFTLKDTTGKAVSLADFKEKKALVIVFLGTECPVNNAYLPRLAELSKAYAGKGAAFLAINSNSQDSEERVAKHARENAIPFPVLKDAGNGVADLFNARRTPEAFVVDARHVIRYRGRIDDQFGVGFRRPAPTHNDLVAALDEVLAGKQVTTPATEVAGCLIARAVKPRADGTVTYAKEVARILQKNCQECHRPGQVGPMALLNYDDAVAWSETIREVVNDKRMPPWGAEGEPGRFRNERRLTDADRQALLAWIDDGCPKGNVSDLPAPKEFPQGWTIGKPDVVFTMKDSYSVPAKTPPGGVPYKYFIVPTNFDEDKWVQAAEARPGNRAVVHHIIVYVAVPGERRERGANIGEGFLVPYAPGDMPAVFAPGQAKKIPKGAVLAFQMHYTPNGTEQSDQSSVGLIFAKGPPEHEVKTDAIGNSKFLIPAGDANHEVTSQRVLKQDILLTGFLPHMHLRGKDFEYRVVYPDGKVEKLLSVPRYDFAWQSNYRLARPLALPAGSRIECTAHFDNSTANPNNPNPSEDVRWGDQTWQEMMIGFIDYVDAKKGQSK